MVVGPQKVSNVNLQLSGKKILVTGSSQGIGAAIAIAFLDEGADVVIVSRGEEKLSVLASELQSKYGESRVIHTTCDCSDTESLEGLRRFIISEWGRLDIVVANVGDGKSVPEAIPSDEEWVRTWNSNFESALQTSRVFVPELKKSKGNLLFISSITALEAFGAPVDYSTAKTAVVAFAKNIARKLAKEVRVNVLAPGNVNFPGSSWDKKIKSDPERIKILIENTVPMNRFGTPEEIADAAVFLCSEKANFITGSVLVIDGGQTVGVL
jgi:3-oxoacyl-[acyl-carrier protein] reductase